MIKFSQLSDIEDGLVKKLNSFILLSFPEVRLHYYDSVIYEINDDGNIEGFAGINIYGNTLLINQLCVNTENRNKGIATSILEYIESNFTTTYIILYISRMVELERSNYLYNFYNKRGYNETYSDKYKYKMCKQLQK